MITKERLLHPATIIGVIALLVALSGVGYAASTIGTAQLKNNAVTTAKIKNNAVTKAKLRNNAVTTAKIKNSAVTTAKLRNNAVTTAKIKNGAVTSSKLANGSVTNAKLANGSITNEKLGPNAVTALNIAGGSVTVANIAPGQVVTGRGSFVAAHQVLAPGASNTPVVTLPGVGQVRASCAAGVTTISFLNQSGTAVEVTAWGVNDATAVTQQSAALGSGLSTTGITAGGTNVLGMTYQVGFVAGNVQHVTTADISAGPAGTSCAVNASALTTG